MATTATEPRNALAFGMTASQWMCDPHRTPEARVLYAILASYTRGTERIAARNVPNRHRLAALLGTDTDGLDAALAELEQAGVVTAVWRSDRRGRVSAIYQLHDAHLLFGDSAAGSAL